MNGLLGRRTLLGALGAGALAACEGRARSQPARRRQQGSPPPLRLAAPFPVGACVRTDQLNDPAFAAILAREFSQLTPEWEMKMESIVQPDGGFRFDAPDRIADFAEAHGLRLYATTLAWHAQRPPAFERIAGDRAAFAGAYRNYMLEVVGRYRGRAVAWDAVNEPVAEDGAGLRDSLWSQVLGPEDYMVQAFADAHEADPAAVLVLNEYNLESLPKKRATFLRLVERLLARGVPIGCLGSQTHLDTDTAPGSVRTALAELARFGLPIHVSELDVSFGRRRLDGRSLAEKLQAQAWVVGEVAEAFAALPPRQRFALTAWGVRDRDSWLKTSEVAGAGPTDQPLLFDDDGRPKPAALALIDAVRGEGGRQGAT